MKDFFKFVVGLSVMVLLGCGGSKSEADKLAESVRQSFASAPEPLKARFQELKSAIEAGDFPKAKGSLDQLKQSQAQLSSEQQMAVAEQEQALMLKASTAAQNGDAKALELIQAVRSERRSR